MDDEKWVDNGDCWKRTLKALDLSAQAKVGLELTYPQAMLVQHWIELSSKENEALNTQLAEVKDLQLWINLVQANTGGSSQAIGLQIMRWMNQENCDQIARLISPRVVSLENKLAELQTLLKDCGFEVIGEHWLGGYIHTCLRHKGGDDGRGCLYFPETVGGKG